MELCVERFDVFRPLHNGKYDYAHELLCAVGVIPLVYILNELRDTVLDLYNLIIQCKLCFAACQLGLVLPMILCVAIIMAAYTVITSFLGLLIRPVMTLLIPPAAIENQVVEDTELAIVLNPDINNDNDNDDLDGGTQGHEEGLGQANSEDTIPVNFMLTDKKQCNYYLEIFQLCLMLPSTLRTFTGASIMAACSVVTSLFSLFIRPAVPPIENPVNNAISPPTDASSIRLM